MSNLEKGRYFIENRSNRDKKGFIFIWVFNDYSKFRHFAHKSDNQNKLIRFNLNFNSKSLNNDGGFKLGNNLKKILYLYQDSEATQLSNQIDAKQFRNDCNVTCLDVSNEQFKFIINRLIESSNQLSKELKISNEYSVAFI